MKEKIIIVEYSPVIRGGALLSDWQEEVIDMDEVHLAAKAAGLMVNGWTSLVDALEAGAITHDEYGQLGGVQTRFDYMPILGVRLDSLSSVIANTRELDGVKD